ncbi:MAG: GNAT family N-acetyltransferase [Sarcina sp.]
MNFKFLKCTIQDLEEKISSYFTDNNILIDSYLEEIIFESNHYKISQNNKDIGFCAVHKKHTLSLFHLDKNFAHLGEEVFFRARKLEFVREAIVSTADEYFLAHAMDSFNNFEKDGYFTKLRNTENKLSLSTTLSLSKIDDLAIINKLSDKYYEKNLSRMLEEKTFYTAKNKNGEIVGFGHAEPGKLAKNKISIGMYVIPKFRAKGHGSDILIALRDIVITLGKEPIAGCWALNHNSLKTQIKAGFYPATRMICFK